MRGRESEGEGSQKSKPGRVVQLATPIINCSILLNLLKELMKYFIEQCAGEEIGEWVSIGLHPPFFKSGTPTLTHLFSGHACPNARQGSIGRSFMSLPQRIPGQDRRGTMEPANGRETGQSLTHLHSVGK